MINSLLNPEPKTIRELIDLRTGTQAQEVFLTSPETGRKLTFLNLQEQAGQLSHRLGRMGLRPGDKVAFLMDNGLFTVQLFLGVIYGGFVLVPLNSRAGAATLAHTLDHSDATVVFVEDQYLGLLKEVMSGLKRSVQVVESDVDGLVTANKAESFDGSLIKPKPEDVALLMYTSGSTGKPKAAIHTHCSLLAHGRNSIAAHQLTQGDCSLLVLPLYHINAECVTLMPTLLSGGSVVIPHQFSVSHFWDWMEKYRCTWSAVVPTIISQLLDWKDPQADSRATCLRRIRFLRSSSAPLSPSLHREFLDKFKLLLIQAMGSTEGGNIFSNPLPPGKNMIGSPGLPWGFETRIINREGVEVSDGEPGEVLLRGPALMRDYYKDPEATQAAVDADGWFHTGDLAYRDPEGYFFVVGRFKELIIKGGVNIAPKQIDEVVESHPRVLEAAAVGVPDRYLGEDIVAFVVLRSAMTGDERELLAFCESRLGHFKTPTRIHFVRDLPKGPSGKIQRLKLQESAAKYGAVGASGNGAPEVGQEQTLPTDVSVALSPIEQTIAGIWAGLLKQPEVDRQANFFSLGGHSLLAIQCLSQLRDKLPLTLSLSDFFEHATIAQQAALVRKRLRPADYTSISTEVTVAWEHDLLKRLGSPAAEEGIPPRNPSEPCPLSPNQERLWFMEQMNAGLPVYNESEAVRLIGKLNVEAMEQSLNLIVARHEILRTTMQVSHEQTAAVVHQNWRLQLKRIDLRALPADQRAAEVERLLIEEPRKPYQLETAPAIRATLVQLDSGDHVFIMMMHHIICDWSSEGVLWRELSVFYRGLTLGETVRLPPLQIQHGDYATWQKQQMANGVFTEDLAYWEKNLRGAPALLELPTDRPRPSVNPLQGRRWRFGIGPSLVTALRECSRREKVSLFTLFTAALDVLLYRYTGSEDILLGIPLADRDRPELQSMIGFLLHTHVLRTRLAGDLKFRELLARVQKGVLDLYAHRSPPFEQVVSRIQQERNLGYSPLFQVMINWRDRDQQLSFIGMEGLKVTSLLAETRTSKFDLTFMLTDDEREIWLEIEYNTVLFDMERIERMAGHYQTLLAGIVANPEMQLSKLPLMTEPERQHVLADWNQTELVYPRNNCLHELFEDRVKLTPDAEALVFENERLTYEELNDRANRLARHLQDLGVGPDSLVGICMERSLEMVTGLLGILKAGGAYVPMDPHYPKERIAFMLEDARPKVLITQQRLLELLPTDSTRVVRLDTDWPAVEKLAKTPVPHHATAQNLAYIIYTSGSTGKPKGVAIQHRGAVSFVTWARQVFTEQEFSGVLFSTSICFDLSVFELFATLGNGGKVILADNALALPNLPAANEVKLVNMVPSAMAELVRANVLPHSVTTVNLAGEPLVQSLVDKLYEGGAVQRVFDLYGPTETTTYSTFTLRRPGGRATIGRPIANTQIYILDHQLQPVPIGVAGELHIGGVGLARGYLNRSELTAQKFIPDPFGNDPEARLYKTGDLCRYRADGNIEFLSRLDQQVKIRGFRIELGEIEAVLATHPNILDAVVVVREDIPGHKALVAYLVLRQKPAPTVADLREFLMQTLPDYMLPAAFINLPALPLTPNGKIDRKALPVPAENRLEQGVQFAAPGSATEVRLASIWCKLLGLERVGIHENFFTLGGNSLLAIQTINEIRRELAPGMPVRILFQYPTIRELARLFSMQQFKVQSPELLQLQEGSVGPEIILIIDGDSVGLFKLSRYMDKELRLYASVVPTSESAIKASAKKQFSALPRLEEIAAGHAALIKSRHPTRSVLLVGYCFSGKLAFEVAHQLQAAGIKVEAVLMLDTMMIGPSNWWMKKVWLQEHLGKLLESGPRYLWRKGRDRIKRETAQFAPRRELFGTTDSKSTVPQSIFNRINRHSAINYQPKPLASRSVLFLSQNWLNNAYRSVDDTLGAGRYFTGGVEVISVQGDHVTFLDEAYLPKLGELFNKTLEQFR